MSAQAKCWQKKPIKTKVLWPNLTLTQLFLFWFRFPWMKCLLKQNVGRRSQSKPRCSVSISVSPSSSFFGSGFLGWNVCSSKMLAEEANQNQGALAQSQSHPALPFLVPASLDEMSAQAKCWHFVFTSKYNRRSQKSLESLELLPHQEHALDCKCFAANFAWIKSRKKAKQHRRSSNFCWWSFGWVPIGLKLITKKSQQHITEASFPHVFCNPGAFPGVEVLDTAGE